MRIFKKTIFILFNLALAVYLVLAITSFNKPDLSGIVCNKVQITIADRDSSGFLSTHEVKRLLSNKQIYPIGQRIEDINLRVIESTLKQNTFIDNVECYKTGDGLVGITVTQRLPLLRVKSEDGQDYYLDTDGKIMQRGRYSSNLIVATGNINNWYAENYLALVARWITDNKLWYNQVEQINILPNKSMELVPRIGGHIINLGRLPESNDKNRREKNVSRFMERKLERLDKFYRYGLNEVGWNKYSYINLEFDNQIICRRDNRKHHADEALPED